MYNPCIQSENSKSEHSVSENSPLTAIVRCLLHNSSVPLTGIVWNCIAFTAQFKRPIDRNSLELYCFYCTIHYKYNNDFIDFYYVVYMSELFQLTIQIQHFSMVKQSELSELYTRTKTPMCFHYGVPTLGTL